MPGPVPKKPHLRQRRNRAATKRTLIRTRPPRQRAPSLPKQRKWHDLTRAWWRDVWHSPMADEFLEADKHALFRLAVLIDLFWTSPSKDLAAEIRLEQQAFGLTPIDRRRLQWAVEEEKEERRTRYVAAQADEGEDPRKILKMVANG